MRRPNLFLRDGLESVAGIKSPLQGFAEGRRDLRVIDGRFMLPCNPRITLSIAGARCKSSAVLFRTVPYGVPQISRNGRLTGYARRTNRLADHVGKNAAIAQVHEFLLRVDA